MKLGNTLYQGPNIPEAFAKHFKEKVENITTSCQIDDNVYNGANLMIAGNENFFNELNVKRCLMNLKIKNCEGFDRIPLRILNDGENNNETQIIESEDDILLNLSLLCPLFNK